MPAMNSINSHPCEFCSEVSGHTTTLAHILSSHELTSRELDRTGSAIAIAGLGAMTPGYVLLIPARHCFCSGHLLPHELDDLAELKKIIRSRLELLYGSAVFFEHGALSASAPGGSCIPHAHIHGFPSRDDYRPTLRANFPEVPIQSLGHLAEVTGKSAPYLFYEDSQGDAFVYTLQQSLPSQYIRRLWAKSIGRDDEFDWAVFPNGHNIAETVRNLRNG
jgi:diadenosine tetraphosphate (Ap4A) HIT family hydrolase